MRSFVIFLFLVTVLYSNVGLAQTVPDIDRWTGQTALSQGQGFSQGDPIRLTWGFVNDGLFIPNFGQGTGTGANSNLDATWTGIYGSQAAYRSVFQQTFDRWSQLSGLEYVFEANDMGLLLQPRLVSTTSAPTCELVAAESTGTAVSWPLIFSPTAVTWSLIPTTISSIT